MNIKIYLNIIFIFIYLLNCNMAYADNWIPVKSEQGKVAEIDIDNLKIIGDFAIYKIKKTTIDKDFIYNMVTDYENKSTSITSMEIWENSKQIAFEDYSKNQKYMPIKEGTLNQSVYDFLLFIKKTIYVDKNSKILKRYFNQLQSQIQRSWHPNNLSGHQPKERAIAYMTLLVDKQGNIIYKKYQNNTNTETKYESFNKQLQKEIEKFYNKHSKLSPLPSDFKGEKVILVIKYEYSFVKDAKSQKLTWNNVGIRYIVCGKNNSFLYLLLQIIFLPVELIYWIFLALL